MKRIIVGIGSAVAIVVAKNGAALPSARVSAAGRPRGRPTSDAGDRSSSYSREMPEGRWRRAIGEAPAIL